MNTLINVLALAAFVFYPSIPIVLLIAHRLITFWRRLGRKSYFVFLAIFLLLDLTALILVLNYHQAILADRLYETPWRLLGLMPLLLGVIIGVMSVRALSLRVLVGLPEVVPAEGRGELVTTGVYRYLRHPRYLEYLLEILGIAILAGTFWNYLLFLYSAAMFYLAARLEEEELIARFGEAYLDYRARVGMFWPRRW